MSIQEFATKYGFNVRTVYRDLQGLQRAGIPIVEDRGRYRLIEGWQSRSAAQLTAEELLALYTARQLAAPLRTTKLGRALDRAWAKLSTTEGQPALVPSAATTGFALRPYVTIDYGRFHRIIETLEHAIAHRRVVDVRYRALQSSEVTARAIEPGSTYFDPALEALYVIAWCRLRGAIRVFAVHRFLAASLRDESFSPRAELTSEVALRDAFRVWRDEVVRIVRIRLGGRAAAEARERTWHPTQTLEELPDGGCVITFEVAALPEVEPWVLAYGEDALVLDPPELRDRIAAITRRTAAAYGDGDRRRSRRASTTRDRGR